MRPLIEKYLRVCPRSGRILGFQSVKGFAALLAPLVGLLALGWVIFRVVTKPSRISYPCVRAALPLASGFVGYVLSVAASVGLWTVAKKRRTVHVMVASALLACISLIVSYSFISEPATAIERQLPTLHLNANAPIGKAVGIFPGRVVWVHRPDATRDACSPASVGHEWYRPENYDQGVIDTMVSTAIQKLTGTSDDAGAWDAIFRFHNANRGKGAVGYAPGEKIFIKTNATSSWGGQFNTSDLSAKTGVWYYAVSETSPGIVLAMLRQLVYVVGVAQQDIYVGDPMKHIYKHCFDIWHAEFPDVHYLDTDGYTNLGRELAVKSTTAKIKYSDRGTVLKDGGTTGYPVAVDFLYDIFDKTEYLLNIPMLKAHKRAGVTMFAKNHFGSHTRPGATHVHGGLVTPNEYPNTPYRFDYGMYRVQVDLMGHELLGKKNLMYFMDALWATDWELDVPLKWKMAPFNDDWMSSVFASLDPVAIESVGYDFLRAEFTETRGAGTYVQLPAVDDYLHQAADTTNWPSGIRYDPENDGTVLASLGTHEHWNDSLHMQYSRNLGTGEGIELVRGDVTTSMSSNLPLVIIDTHGQVILDEPKITADMGVIDNGPGRRNALSDPFNGYYGKIGIEIRGSSSQQFPKKQYAVETQDSLGEELSVPLLGLPAESDWVLYAVYNDKSLIRDALMFSMARSLGRYASRARFCELILNGEYIGVYVLLEKIGRNKNRVSITKLTAADTLGDAVTGGYIVKIDKTDGSETAGWYSGLPPYPWASQRIYYQYHYPKRENLSWPQVSYITQYIRDFEVAMYGSGFADTATGYSHWLDVDALVDYVLLNELGKNVDGFRLSFFMYKDRDSKGGKLVLGPLWDNTLSFGNCDYYDASQVEGFQWTYLTTDPSFLHSDYYQVPFWIKKLLNYPALQARLQQRWNALRSDQLSDGRVTAIIDSLTALIDEGRQRNFSRWPILGQYVWPNAFVSKTYAEEVDYLKNWVGGRLRWMDQALNTVSVGERSGRDQSPARFALEQNYPNPFNPKTVVRSQLSVASQVKLAVYDLLGREVAVLVDEWRPAGRYQDVFSAGDGSLTAGDQAPSRGGAAGLSSGIYIYRLTAGSFVCSRTMVLLK